MRKFYSTVLMLAMMVAALSFASCSKDDDGGGGDTSKLVGTWDVVQDVYYLDGEVEDVEEGYGNYWVFTNNTLTVHDIYDLMDGKTVDYTVKGDKLHVAGMDVHTIVEISSTKLVLRSTEIMGGYDIITFKKR